MPNAGKTQNRVGAWTKYCQLPKTLGRQPGAPRAAPKNPAPQDQCWESACGDPPSGWTKHCQSTLDSGGRGLHDSCSINVFLALRRSRATCKTGNIPSMHRKGFVLTGVPLPASDTLPWTCCCALRARVTPAAGRTLRSKLRASGSSARALPWAAGSATSSLVAANGLAGGAGERLGRRGPGVEPFIFPSQLSHGPAAGRQARALHYKAAGVARRPETWGNA